MATKLTFVPMSGPALDHDSAKLMRAHTTKANFARRRQRRVQDYAERKNREARLNHLHIQGQEPNEQIALTNVHQPSPRYEVLHFGLSETDSYFIDHLAQAMERLYLVIEDPPTEPTKAVISSDWARFLPDPTMLIVSLYMARYVYASNLRISTLHLALETQKGLALRSVRKRLSGGSDDLTDSLFAAILILSVLDQVATNAQAWKIHISGLIRLLTVRTQSSTDVPAPWMLRAVPHTTMQGLITLSRHDETLVRSIQMTGVFDTLFSPSARGAAYLVLTSTEAVLALQQDYSCHGAIHEQDRNEARRIIASLDDAIRLNTPAAIGEVFLTTTALSMQIFLHGMLHDTSSADTNTHVLSLQLMEMLHKPEQQLDPSLMLCSYLDSRFWQATMGALAASEISTKGFFVSRLKRIAAALALRTWQDAEQILLRFFWIPSLWSDRGSALFADVLSSPEVRDS